MKWKGSSNGEKAGSAVHLLQYADTTSTAVNSLLTMLAESSLISSISVTLSIGDGPLEYACNASDWIVRFCRTIPSHPGSEAVMVVAVLEKCSLPSLGTEADERKRGWTSEAKPSQALIGWRVLLSNGELLFSLLPRASPFCGHPAPWNMPLRPVGSKSRRARESFHCRKLLWRT